MFGNKMRVLAITSGLVLAPGFSVAVEPDWGVYSQLLERHVTSGVYRGVALNWVDYRALHQDPLYAQLIGQLAGFSPARLATREERLAFYINAYNVLAIKTVVDHWPVNSIKDAGSLFNPVWEQPAGQVGGETYTLDEIEHRILRPMGEPRVHFAIVCASVSCPDLHNEPYTAQQLEAQLSAQSRHFLRNSAKGLRIEKNSVRISRIFEWVKDDFVATGGVRRFIADHYPGLPPQRPLETDLPYDWTLNGVAHE